MKVKERRRNCCFQIKIIFCKSTFSQSNTTQGHQGRPDANTCHTCHEYLTFSKHEIYWTIAAKFMKELTVIHTAEELADKWSLVQCTQNKQNEDGYWFRYSTSTHKTSSQSPCQQHSTYILNSTNPSSQALIDSAHLPLRKESLLGQQCHGHVVNNPTKMALGGK